MTRPPAPHRATKQPPTRPSATAGYVARELAVTTLVGVLADKRPMETVIAEAVKRPEFATLEPRDRAFARLIATTVFRQHGDLSARIDQHLEKSVAVLPARAAGILLAGAAQLVVLETPPHAAISLAVDQARAKQSSARFAGLTNAVLRKVATGAAALPAQSKTNNANCNYPDWLWQRWVKAYGADTAHAIAARLAMPPPLDVSVLAEPKVWAETLGGTVLATGSVRIDAKGRVEDLAGYEDGAWWVQDAAAALPVKLLGDELVGMRALDLCAAPGGKTAALAAAGADVTAVDISAVRLQTLQQNLDRLGLSAAIIEADVFDFETSDAFDCVLLDAPCTATGTIRRHPDIPFLKRATDVAQLVETQRQLLQTAARCVKPGGQLVYCVCSLETDEGEAQAAWFLDAHPRFQRERVEAGEAGISADWITADGDLRTLPSHLTLATPQLSGLDGFFAARFRAG